MISTWQRKQKAACLRAEGYTYRQIGELFGVSTSRASQLAEDGLDFAQPDEIVFPNALFPDSPVRVLPISKKTRAALGNLKFATFGELCSEDQVELSRRLLRFAGIGKRHVDELAELITQASDRQRKCQKA